MDIDFPRFDNAHLLGDCAMRPIAPRLTRQAALSRLAWHANHGTLGRIQLRFLGSFNRSAICYCFNSCLRPWLFG